MKNLTKPEGAEEVWPTCVLPEQARTEVYANQSLQIVVKQEGYSEESIIIIDPVFLEKFIGHLRSTKRFIESQK